MNAQTHDRLLGCFLGLAVGDCVGAPLEFKKRDTYQHLTDMVGGGPFNLQPGQWTDDTSMAICLAESILACDRIDADDLRGRWTDWWQNGTNSSTGRCFDIGTGTAQALRSGAPGGAGNGAMMRLAPVVLRWPSAAHARAAAIAQAAVTHGPLARNHAAALAGALVALARGERPGFYAAGNSLRRKSRDEISSSGYCVHTLEAATWCFLKTNNFRDAVLLAANLGDDADTVAAVTGQLAGAKYGRSGIPEKWLAKLHDGDRLLSIAHKLIAAGER